jgi:hypothetical protein
MKKAIKWFLVLLIILLIIKGLSKIIAEPLLKKKAISELNKMLPNENIEIANVQIKILKKEIKINGITALSRINLIKNRNIDLKIASLKISGLSISKAIFKKQLYITKAVISNSSMSGKVLFPGKSQKTVLSPIDITINEIIFDKADLDLKDLKTKKSFFQKEGVLLLYGFRVNKNDTITPGNIEDIEFSAKEITCVSADSMYSYKIHGLVSSSVSGSVNTDSFFLMPNYKDYDFTSRYDFQKDRFEAEFINISLIGFRITDFLTSGNLRIQYADAERMKIDVFRDKRKEFRHIEKPAFQEMIKNYNGILDIDSIAILNGGVSYSEHSEKGIEPGSIIFDKIYARIYNVSNRFEKDSIKLPLILKASALLMNKGKIDVFLKGELNGRDNIFTVEGNLKDIEAKEFNRFIEKTSLIFIAQGKIDEMKFRFSADNTSSNGNLSLVYHGLDVALLNRATGDTTALKERFISFIINKKIHDSNPLPGEEMRLGIIKYKRDPERFLFSYCAKSILSGIKTSITGNSDN